MCLTMCAFYRRAAEIGADASPQSNLSEQEKADLVTSLRQMFRKATGYLTMIPQDQDKDDLCYEVPHTPGLPPPPAAFPSNDSTCIAATCLFRLASLLALDRKSTL